jgi:alanyl-tRNA synthetase
MRRGMRHAHILGTKDPLMYRLVPTLVAEMGEAYPELKRAEALVSETLKLEEARFRETLARGLKLLDEATSRMKPGDTLPGEVAFKLYDTFGFPRDLTEDALRERGMKVDIAGFDASMAAQRADARKAWAGSGEAATDTSGSAARRIGRDGRGYDIETAEGAITAIVKDGTRAERPRHETGAF